MDERPSRCPFRILVQVVPGVGSETRTCGGRVRPTYPITVELMDVWATVQHVRPKDIAVFLGDYAVSLGRELNGECVWCANRDVTGTRSPPLEVPRG